MIVAFARQLDVLAASAAEMEDDLSILKARVNRLEREGTLRSVRGVSSGQRARRSAGPFQTPYPRTLVLISTEDDSEVEEISAEEYYSPPVVSPSNTMDLPDGSSELEYPDGTRVFAGPRRDGSIDRAESPPPLPVPEPIPREL